MTAAAPEDTLRRAHAKKGAAGVGACRDSGAPILWARSERGRWTPMDPEPDPDGDFALRDGTAGYCPTSPRRVGAFFHYHGLRCPARTRGRTP